MSEEKEIEALGIIETNIQVRVLTNLLYMIDKDLLEKSILNTPDELKDSAQYKVLVETAAYRDKIEDILKNEPQD